MWYAVQVETGKESVIKNYCSKIVDKTTHNDIFVLRFNKVKKFYGKWHQESKVMFPGYIFIDTDTPEQVYEALKNVPAFTSLLGRDKDSFVPIERSKEELFRKMVNDNYEIAMSCGMIEGDKVTITDGPLAGKEAMICKINRHKRTATLNVEMFGDKVGGDCWTGGCGEEGLAKLVCKRNVFQFLGLLGVRTGADMNLSKM